MCFCPVQLPWCCCHRRLRTRPGHEQELCLLGCICHISPCVGCCPCSGDPAGTQAGLSMQVLSCLCGVRTSDAGQARHRTRVPEHDVLLTVCLLVSPGQSRAPPVLWGGAGGQKFLFLQWHTHRDGIHPAHGLSVLLFPSGRRSSSDFLLHSIFQMCGLILQCLSLMRGVNEQLSLFLGKEGGEKTSACCALLSPRDGDKALFHPSGSAGSLQ